MTISIDSNVIAGLWDTSDEINLTAKRLLQNLSTTHSLMVTGVVFAELMGGPQRDADFLTTFFRKTRIAVDWALDEATLRLAGEGYRSYCASRRDKLESDLPRRVLTDFLIGAHAQVKGHALLTLDQRLYRAAFPKLHLVGA